jgi:nicotinate-nucleotide pyrophosphorylase (carboxylating)
MDTPFDRDEVLKLVRMALAEDVGRGDVTTNAAVPADATARANVVAREPGVVAGLAVIDVIFRELGGVVRIELRAKDGERVERRTVLAILEGNARTILAAERTLLNFLQRLSGIATLTRRFVDAVAGTRARIYDTRKTTPGWRTIEKYAVRVGGGENHRMGLYDMALIKDNHLAWMRAQGRNLADVVADLRRKHPAMPVEVEAEDDDGIREVVAAGSDMILLDNMTPARLAEAVRLVESLAGEKRPELEASGGVTLDTVRAIAESGVDRISVGALTHSAKALDIALDFET